MSKEKKKKKNQKAPYLDLVKKNEFSIVIYHDVSNLRY